MALTEAQEDVLCLLGHDAAEDLDAAQLLIVDQLAREDLAEWRGETPALTPLGHAELVRLLLD